MKKPKSAIPVGKAPNRRLHQLGAEEVDLNDPGAAQLVKMAYARERARWESIKVGKKVRYVLPAVYDGAKAVTVENADGPVLEKARKNVWARFSKWLVDNDVHNPSSYLAFQFDALTHELKRAPEPHQLMTADKLANYKESLRGLNERVRVALLVQKGQAERQFAYLRNAMSAEDAWVSVLLDGSLELSPLFRYCIAAGLGGRRFGKIAARYHADAIMQFERYRRWYKKQWASLLPKGFAAESKRIYPHLLVR